MEERTTRWFESNKKDPLRSLLNGGQRWIRTTVPSREQIYSLSPLATRPSTHIIFSNLPLTGFEPVASPLPRECATPAPQRHNVTRFLNFQLADFKEYQGSAATLLHCDLTFSQLSTESLPQRHNVTRFSVFHRKCRR